VAVLRIRASPAEGEVDGIYRGQSAQLSDFRIKKTPLDAAQNALVSVGHIQ